MKNQVDNNEDSYEALLEEAMRDPEVRVAFKENELRRVLGAAFDEARSAQELSVRALAKRMNTSTSQVQRVLHNEVGGSLTLSTVCRAADALDLCVRVQVRPETQQIGALVKFGKVAYTSARLGEVRRDKLRPSRAALVTRSHDSWAVLDEVDEAQPKVG